MKKYLLLFSLLLSGCVSIPDGLEPVKGFNINRYLGKWYEIARLDHSFERGLTAVTANYSYRKDGGVRVLNKGFNTEKQSWKSAEGKAYFVKDETDGFLKVSFFGPFYGSYILLDLDKENYQYALVCGPNRKYLWILARTPDLDREIIERLVHKATDLGFNTDELIFIDHSRNVE